MGKFLGTSAIILTDNDSAFIGPTASRFCNGRSINLQTVNPCRQEV